MDWVFIIRDWLLEHKEWLYGFGVFSAVTTVIGIVIIPMLIAKMAPDYFLDKRVDEASLKYQHPVLRILGIILKNLLGVILILFGVVLCFPGVLGQGILTILIGLMIMDFRGKRKLEIWLIRLGPVNRSVNWIRKKKNQPPLVLPEKK